MPFPFSDGADSPVLDELIGGPAAALTVVALVVAPGARASGWGARAAVELAARWRGSRRILLADLDLGQPVLHELAHVPNEEGVIDVVEYGISLGRLIRSAGDGAYDVLPAGLFAPDPGAILRHDGWRRVLLEIAARRGTLLAWVPAEADGVEAVIERAGAVIILAEEGEGREVVERLPHPYAVLAVLTPDTTPVHAEAHDTAEAAGVEATEAAALAGVPDESAPEVVEAGSIEATEAGTLAAVPEEPAPDETRGVGPQSAAPDFAEAAAPVEEAEPPEAAVTPAEPETPALPVRPEEFVPPGEPETPPPSALPEAAVPAVSGGYAISSEEARLLKDSAARAAMTAALRERQRAARLAGATVAVGAPAAAAGPAAAAATEGSAEAAALTGTAEAAAPAGAAVAPASGTDAGDAESARTPEAEAAERPRLVTRPHIRKRPRFSRPLAWTIGVVLLASLLAGAWHFLTSWVSAPDPEAATTAPAPAAPTAAPAVQNALPFVVAIEAHRELTTALNRVTDLTEIEPGLLFHVESIVRDGTLFHHVMAGPVTDSAAALALRDTLVARGHKTGETPTDVRATPLVYLIGDYGTRAGAVEQRELLRPFDIAGYVIPGVAADGQQLHRLYVGGFGSEAEADFMGQMLRDAGIRDSLITRTGTTTLSESLVARPDSIAAVDSPGTPTGSSIQ